MMYRVNRILQVILRPPPKKIRGRPGAQAASGRLFFRCAASRVLASAYIARPRACDPHVMRCFCAGSKAMIIMRKSAGSAIAFAEVVSSAAPTVVASHSLPGAVELKMFMLGEPYGHFDYSITLEVADLRRLAAFLSRAHSGDNEDTDGP